MCTCVEIINDLIWTGKCSLDMCRFYVPSDEQGEIIVRSLDPWPFRYSRCALWIAPRQIHNFVAPFLQAGLLELWVPPPIVSGSAIKWRVKLITTKRAQSWLEGKRIGAETTLAPNGGDLTDQKPSHDSKQEEKTCWFNSALFPTRTTWQSTVIPVAL